MPPTSGTSKHKSGVPKRGEAKDSDLPAFLRKGLYGSDKHCKRGPLLGGTTLPQVLVISRLATLMIAVAIVMLIGIVIIL